jgi:hypothetical protein
MGERWIAEAEQLTPSGAPGTMSGVGPPRAICHVTVSRPGSFDAMHRVLTDKMAEPHLLYDWATDRLGQYFPLDRSARALKRGARDVSCNKVGTVCIQIEFCSMPDGFTRYWTPGPNFRALMRAIASWGITPQFVARANTSAGDNVRQTWETYLATGGWWGHCHVPENDHWDPGPIDQAAFFAAAGITTTPQEDDMATPAEIAAAVWAAPMDGETMGNRLYFAHRRAQAAVDDLRQVRAELAVLAAKVDALTASPVSGTVTVTGGTLTVGT